MITVTFSFNKADCVGFCISGHSGYSEQGSDIVCSAVSSAAYMAVNTITEILHINPKVAVKDGFLSIALTNSEAEKASVILDGFALHITALCEQYPDYIIVNNSEV